VIDHGDQLREAFQTHEHLAPDPAAVYARVQELSRTYRRRRRGAQAAGGAVLGVGLLAGAVNVPALLPGQPQDTIGVVAGAPAVPTTSATPSLSPEQLQQAWDAYFGAGYDYDDAVRLAKLWNMTDEVGSVKAEAGRRLLAGEALPFAATPEGPANPSPGTPEPGGAQTDPAEARRIEAFFGAGYVYDDAVELAELWKIADPYEAKAEAGKKLLAGKKLPIKPSPENVAVAKEGKQVEAFFDAGYDYEDAVRLAELWRTADAYQAKVQAGKKILAGDDLPFKP
jgi:hypothetical protein